MTNRSVRGKFAHLIERCGLALAGAACGLYVAAYMLRVGDDVLSSAIMLILVMAVGAVGFYLGIDVPPPAHRQTVVSSGGAVEPDPVEILSAVGTFIAAFAALLAVYAIVTDSISAGYWTVAIPLGWSVGALLQIIAGTIARLRA